MAQGISRQIERAQLILDVLHEDEWITSAEIGRLLGVGRQAVTPYMKSLKEIGHDIESVKGKGHRIRGNPACGSLLLSQEELYVLFLSLSRSKADFPADVLSRLQSRLLTLLSEQRQHQAKKLKVSPDAERSYFQDFEILRTVQSSIEKETLLGLEYQGLKDAAPRSRQVVPVEFVPKRDWWYLVAYEVKSSQEKHFRIDRISSAVNLPNKAQLPENFARSSMHPWDFGTNTVEVSLKVRPDLARWLREDPAHHSQRLEPLKDGHWKATYNVATVGKFLDWLMGLRGFALLGPESVRLAMQQRAHEILSDQGTLNTPWEI